MSAYDDSNVIDLVARRRCQLEARSLDPASIAAHVLAETGTPIPTPATDGGYDDGGYDDGGYAA